jgi:hypothetical protein
VLLAVSGKIAVKKKLQTRYGEISMNKSHKYLQVHQGSDNSFVGISPFRQEKMVYAGQFTNYQEGVSLLHKFYGIEISQTQHFRLTSHYGSLCSGIVEKERSSEDVPEGEVVYAQCDGSMILTREKVKESGEDDSAKGSWQEVKLCRVFRSGERYRSGKRTWIDSSGYVAHMGAHKEFKELAENLIDPYDHLGERLVFISDGAAWIHNRQKETYPKATQILDFYHACEHLAVFAQVALTDGTLREKWLGERKTELLNDGYDSLVQQVGELARDKPRTVQQAGDKLLQYYQNNKDRMDYKSYREKGLHIGSGAIEAAHRNVIQKRMKQSGQRWTRKRAQNVLNLRICYMSGYWNEVVNIIRKSAA